MTNQQAIEQLHMIAAAYSHDKKDREALSMAAEALEEKEQREGKWKILTYLFLRRRSPGSAWWEELPLPLG